MNVETWVGEYPDDGYRLEQLYLEPESEMDKDIIGRLLRSGLGGHRGDPQTWWGDIEIGDRATAGFKCSWKLTLEPKENESPTNEVATTA